MITSDRLRFRRYTNEDFDFLMSLLSDPDVVRYIGNGNVRDKEGGQEFLNWIYRTYEFGEYYGLMVLVNKEDNSLIGHAGFVPQTIDGKEEIEIGYWIAKRYWGKGYATEAAKTLLDYGKAQLKLERFIALIQPANTASKKVAEKIGMTLEKEIVLKGQDVYLYSLS